MNLSEFIEFTNSEQYYLNANLSCIHIASETSNIQNLYFDLLLDVDYSLGESIKQKWRVRANGCEFAYNMINKFLGPYIQMKLYTDHPLLWHYNSKLVECKLQGFPKNQDLFLGQLYQSYIKISKNWIQASKDFFATEYAYKDKGFRNLTIPFQLKTSIETICKNHQIEFTIVKTEYPFKNKKIQALVFTNDYVSPDNFNMGQPYVLAENFTIEKIQ
ncbi:hypothetical protein GCM10022393_37120 [Aquimarina addita]|uniref:Uncharacterized protein n=1 Tax=Aquimarina addita TaxID=870485 RepID=A0ABP6URJ2_9FLAO